MLQHHRALTLALALTDAVTTGCFSTIVHETNLRDSTLTLTLTTRSSLSITLRLRLTLTPTLHPSPFTLHPSPWAHGVAATTPSPGKRIATALAELGAMDEGSLRRLPALDPNPDSEPNPNPNL